MISANTASASATVSASATATQRKLKLRVVSGPLPRPACSARDSKKKEKEEKEVKDVVAVETVPDQTLLERLYAKTETTEELPPVLGGEDVRLIKSHLTHKGYVVVPNVLSEEEIAEAKRLMRGWQDTIPDHERFHSSVNPHGIYKYHRAGHTEHAWFIRTLPAVQQLYALLWDVPEDEMVVSHDGCCYISKSCKKKDKIWTHSDQAPTATGFQCWQSFVALTENRERTLVVYEKSHLVHKEYFAAKGVGSSSKAWQRIDLVDLPDIAHMKRVLHVPAGAMVLWDSRVFHQNQYGAPNSEERMVQYVCYMPKSSKKNSPAMQKKRRKYFDEMRTTSHWPYPLHVNGLQPQTYGDDSLVIPYDKIPKPDIERFMPKILPLL